MGWSLYSKQEAPCRHSGKKPCRHIYNTLICNRPRHCHTCADKDKSESGRKRRRLEYLGNVFDLSILIHNERQKSAVSGRYCRCLGHAEYTGEYAAQNNNREQQRRNCTFCSNKTFLAADRRVTGIVALLCDDHYRDRLYDCNTDRRYHSRHKHAGYRCSAGCNAVGYHQYTRRHYRSEQRRRRHYRGGKCRAVFLFFHHRDQERS